MLISILRSIGSVVAGIAVWIGFFVAGEVFSEVFHPFPQGVEQNHVEMCKHVARYPTWVLATGAAIWAGGVLASCWLATWLGTGRHPAHGIVVGVLLLMLVGMNLAMLPYAPWFPIVMLVSFPISIYWGTKWGRGGVSRHEGSGIPKGK